MAELKMNIQMCVNPLPGRTVMLQFECGRCGKKHTEPFESFKVPEGWREHERNMPLLCPECHKAFNEFMKGGDQK